MTPRQRLAHLAFRYDAEVQNGGHHQYFENSAGRRCHETVGALLELGLECQASILQRATDLWESIQRAPTSSVEEFAADALEGEFDEHDLAYHACSPTITEALERLLEEHPDEFVLIVQPN